jgi:hypothetical protein
MICYYKLPKIDKIFHTDVDINKGLEYEIVDDFYWTRNHFWFKVEYRGQVYEVRKFMPFFAFPKADDKNIHEWIDQYERRLPDYQIPWQENRVEKY